MAPSPGSSGRLLRFSLIMEQVINSRSDTARSARFVQRLLAGGRSMREKGGGPLLGFIAAILATGIWLGISSQAEGVSALPTTSWLFESQVKPENALPVPSSARADPEPFEARSLNAAIPFAPDAGVPARPFIFGDASADRDRAVDCLALAAMAEAGNGDDGQRAVIQVILNRVRHPAFAKSICGVVFEGSHRSTGCQFTFTCDGALARRYSPTAWSRARARASDALEGRVYAPVGLATHYHTDWVHPYWSASLVKLARVDTHLFFKWPGYWGTPTAFNFAYRGKEPIISVLAYLPAHAGGVAELAEGVPVSGQSIDTSGIDVVVRNQDGGAFVLLTRTMSAERAREVARSVCSVRPSCKVFGWFDRASIPASYPVPRSARAKIGFSYFRGLGNDETVLYDCSRFASVTVEKCLPLTNRKHAGDQEAGGAPLG